MKSSGIPQKKGLLTNRFGGPSAIPQQPAAKKSDRDVLQKYAIITAATLNDQKGLYDQMASISQEYEIEMENTFSNIRNGLVAQSINFIQNFDVVISKFFENNNDKLNCMTPRLSQIEDKCNFFSNKIKELKQEKEELKQLSISPEEREAIVLYHSQFENLVEKQNLLNEEIAQKNNQISLLEGQLATKATEIESMKKEYTTQLQNINSTSENEQRLKKMFVELENENKKLIQENKEFRESTTKLNSVLQEVQNRMNQTNSSYQSVLQSNQEKDQQVNVLLSKIESLKATKSSQENAQIGQLLNEKDVLLQENKDIKNKVETLNRMLELLQSSAPKESHDRQQQIKVIDQLKEENENLKSVINAKDLEIEELKSFAYERDQVDDQKDDAISDTLLKIQIEQKDKEINVLNAEINEKQNMIDELKSKLNQDNSLQSFVDSLSKISEETEKNETMSKQLEEKSNLINQLNAQISNKDEIIKTMSDKIGENEQLSIELSAEISKKDKEIDSLKIEIEEKDQKISGMAKEFDEQSRSISSLSKEVKDKTSAISSISAQLDEKDQMIDSLEAQISGSKQELEKLKKEKIEFQDNLNSLTDQMNSLKLQLEESSANDESPKLKAEISELKSKQQSMDLQIEEMQSMISSKDSQIEELMSRQTHYLEQLKEGESLIASLNNMKTEFNQQKILMSQAEESKNQIICQFDGIHKENAKLSEDLASLQNERDQLKEQLQEAEDKLKQTNEDEKTQLIEHIKEMEETSNDLREQVTRLSIVENLKNNLEEELKSAKLMIETYKQMKDILQKKLETVNFQNQELNKIYNSTPRTPVQKCTVSCSPMKLPEQMDLDIDVQAVLEENISLKNDIEEWKNSANLLRKSVQDTKDERDFYQSECGKLNSMIMTAQFDFDANTKKVSTLTKELSQLQENYSALQRKYRNELMSNKDGAKEMDGISQQLLTSQRSFNNLKLQYNQFLYQLSTVLQKQTEQEIISAVIHLLNSSGSISLNNGKESIVEKIQQVMTSHTCKMESLLQKVNLRVDSAESSISRIGRKLQLTERKFGLFSRNPNSTIKRRPLAQMNTNTMISTPKSIPTKKFMFYERESPSNLEDAMPKPRRPLFA